MIASQDNAHPDHIFTSEKQHHVLRTSALYGANAHGKSKLLEAMALAKKIIINNRKVDETIPIIPFRLDAQLQQEPSQFEFTFLSEGVEYTYGFVANTTTILEEWLFARPKKREVRLFERITDTTGQTKIEFGNALAPKKSKDRDFLAFLERGLRTNQLFLTEAVDRNLNTLNPVFQWFSNRLNIVFPNQSIQNVAIQVHKDHHIRAFVNNFLNSADTGISSVKIETNSAELDAFFPNISKTILQEIETHFEDEGGFVSNLSNDAYLKNNDNFTRVKLLAQHQQMNGDVVSFDFEDESSGTQRLLQMLPILWGQDGRVTIMDELDRTLHPHLSRLIVETFLKRGNTDQSQLIFTSHETSLLNLDLLRRDEIWFVEKDTQGKAHLFPLNDFHARPDLKIERGYLQGRFGAIPFIGDTTQLGWNELEYSYEDTDIKKKAAS